MSPRRWMATRDRRKNIRLARAFAAMVEKPALARKAWPDPERSGLLVDVQISHFLRLLSLDSMKPVLAPYMEFLDQAEAIDRINRSHLKFMRIAEQEAKRPGVKVQRKPAARAEEPPKRRKKKGGAR